MWLIDHVVAYPQLFTASVANTCAPPDIPGAGVLEATVKFCPNNLILDRLGRLIIVCVWIGTEDDAIWFGLSFVS